jgi:hypothetical protein
MQNRITRSAALVLSPGALRKAGFHLPMPPKSNPHLKTSESVICHEVSLVQKLKCGLKCGFLDAHISLNIDPNQLAGGLLGLWDRNWAIWISCVSFVSGATFRKE